MKNVRKNSKNRKISEISENFPHPLYILPILQSITINGIRADFYAKHELYHMIHLPWLWHASTYRGRPVFKRRFVPSLLYTYLIMDIPTSWRLKPKSDAYTRLDVNPFRYEPRNGYTATYRDFLSDEVKVLIDVIPYYKNRDVQFLLEKLPAFTEKQIEEALKHV